MTGQTSNYQTPALLIFLWITLLPFEAPGGYSIPQLKMVCKLQLSGLSLNFIVFVGFPYKHNKCIFFLLLIYLMLILLLDLSKNTEEQRKTNIIFLKGICKVYYFSCSGQNPCWHISHIPLQIFQQSLLAPISQYIHSLISHYLCCYHLTHSSSVSWTTMITSSLVSLLLECLSLQKHSLTLYSKSLLKS